MPDEYDAYAFAARVLAEESTKDPTSAPPSMVSVTCHICDRSFPSLLQMGAAELDRAKQELGAQRYECSHCGAVSYYDLMEHRVAD